MSIRKENNDKKIKKYEETIIMNLKENNAQFIPLRANSKAPSESFKGVNFDTEYLTKHVKNGGNLGLLSQPDLIFIDIDTHKGIDGMQNFTDWLESNNLNAKEVIEGTLSQTTPTNGIHLIYAKPKGLNFIQDIGFLPNVDIKASENNYIVFYPSKIDGKQYTLNNNNPIIELPMPLAEALKKQANYPKVAKHHLRNSKPETHTLSATTDEGLYIKVHSTRYGDKVDPFFNIANGWGSEGQRNVIIFKWAQAMRNITDIDTAYYYADIANEHSEEPYPDSELYKTIQSAYDWKREPKPEKGNESALLKQLRN